jgi:hypothetical protein
MPKTLDMEVSVRQSDGRPSVAAFQFAFGQNNMANENNPQFSSLFSWLDLTNNPSAYEVQAFPLRIFFLISNNLQPSSPGELVRA